MVLKMPVIKDDREYSDAEEMEHESPDSEKTSTCSETSDGSDTDDSSEMDEEECERRRTECMEDLADLERQFTLLREQLYRERVTQVEGKLDEVKVGRAQEYTQPVEDLQQNMHIRTKVAGILRQLRLANIQNKFEAEQLAAQQNFESEKTLLWDSIQGDLEEKIRRLEEDRNNVDITSDLWLEQTFRKSRRKSDSVGPDKRRKPVTVTGPYLVYMLSDADILEDWTTIKKALSAAKLSHLTSLCSAAHLDLRASQFRK